MNSLLATLPPLVVTSIVIFLPALLLLAFGAFFRRYTDQWEHEERGFTKMSTHWHKAFITAFLVGESSAILAGFLSQWNIYAVLIFAILGYSLSFSSYTDIIEHKAPKEIARWSIVTLIPIAVVALIDNGLYVIASSQNFILRLPYFPVSPDLSMQQLVAFGVWMIIPIVMLLVSGGGLGMADIRLFVLFAVGLSWWVGIMAMFTAFFIANVIQALSFIPAKKYNWGHMVTLKSGKQKRAMPFIPALSVTFMLMGFYMLPHTLTGIPLPF